MKNILEFLEKSETKFANKTVFIDESSEISYHDFLLKSQVIGSMLLNNSVECAPVAILLDKTIESLAVMMGVVYSGSYYSVLDTKMPTARMNIILNDLSPNAILTDRKHGEQLKETGFNGKVLFIDEATGVSPDPIALDKIRKKSIDTDPVYILFTSGSTGVPKGTVVCHRSIISYTEWVSDTFHLNENTIFGNQTPFFFSMSVLDIFCTIRNAATMCIIPKKFFAFPKKLIDFLSAQKINTIYWVPSALSIISNWKLFDFMPAPEIKTVLFAGEVMPAKVLNYWCFNLKNALFANLYGPTEVTDICTYYIVNRDFTNDEVIPIGNACNNCDVMVVTLDGREAEQDEEGELYVRGSFLSMGYYNNPQKTNEVFVQNPLNQHYPELVYKTGDIVKRNSFGELLYVTRKDFQIKHMGYRIELGEIEAAAGAVEGIDCCAGIYDTQLDQIILFYKGNSVDSKTLLKDLQKRLPRYMLPTKLIRLERMLYNSNGKIDRPRLKIEYKTGLKEA